MTLFKQIFFFNGNIAIEITVGGREIAKEPVKSHREITSFKMSKMI